MKNLNRREFICGAAAGIGALECGGVFGAAGEDDRPPNLKFGVLSDIHFRLDFKTGAGLAAGYGESAFVRALEYFREAGVDAVVVAGDLADTGMVAELEAVAAAWFRVFPNDRAPDGRKVERVFITGNHDFVGWSYECRDQIARLYPDKVERERHCLKADMKGRWERIFHEPYAPAFVKTVKGYPFIGAHWGDSSGQPAAHALIGKVGRESDAARPFFYVQHPQVRDTVFGYWAWGHDDGKSTKALSAFPNAVAFSGHSHYSMADERAIWQGAFTSVGVGSLRNASHPYDEFVPRGFENAGQPWGWGQQDDKLIGREKVNPVTDKKAQQGLLVSVYDDRMTVERRDFSTDLPMGGDWVVPLRSGAGKPYAFAQRRLASKAPQFAPGARVAVRMADGKNRANEARRVFELSFPAANAAGDRPYAYEVTARLKDGTEFPSQMFLASSYCCSRQDPRFLRPMVCRIDRALLPGGEDVLFAVRPVGWFGVRGRAIESGGAADAASG